MRIGIDAHVINGMFQGSRTYIESIYKEITSHSTDHEFFFLGHWKQSVEVPQFQGNVNFIDYPNHSRLRRIMRDSGQLSRILNLDIFHAQYILPFNLQCAGVVTIHDILPDTHPEFFPPIQRLRCKMLYRNSSIRAKQIHAGSEYTKKMLVDIYRLEPEKIYVVPSGVCQAKFSLKLLPLEKKAADPRDTYLLTVGRLEPRKNHANLLRAFKLAKDQNRHIGKLLIVGQRDFGYERIFRLIADLNLTNFVEVLENVDSKELAMLYQNAWAFIYPSFAEGFGIPPLEAMASGTPVIASTGTAIDEVCGSASIPVDPYDPTSIAAAILELFDNNNLKSRLIASGLKRVAQYSWEKSAAKYFKAITTI